MVDIFQHILLCPERHGVADGALHVKTVAAVFEPVCCPQPAFACHLRCHRHFPRPFCVAVHGGFFHNRTAVIRYFKRCFQKEFVALLVIHLGIFRCFHPVFFMGIFPLHDQVADGCFNVRTRYFPANQAFIKFIFLILTAVYADQIRHITVIGDFSPMLCTSLPFQQLLHVPPCAVHTACHFLANHGIAVFYNDLTEVHFRSDNLHVFLPLYKLPDFRIFQSGIDIDSADFRVHFPCDM